MDNCFGQNKKCMVLQLAPFLVESGYFNEVNFIFFVVSHTKNAADCLFNLAKINIRKDNIFSMHGFINACGKHELIMAQEVFAQEFLDYDKYFDGVYNQLKTPGILKWQKFTCNNVKVKKYRDPNYNENDKPKECPKWEMSFRTSTLVDTESNTYIVENDVVDRHDNFCKRQQVVEEPILKDIKQVELFEKYRPLFPPHYRDVLCPEPSPSVIAHFKGDKKQKAKDTRDKKRKAVDMKSTIKPASKTAFMAADALEQEQSQRLQRGTFAKQ
jgi:hypothetical protein